MQANLTASGGWAGMEVQGNLVCKVTLCTEAISIEGALTAKP